MQHTRSSVHFTLKKPLGNIFNQKIVELDKKSDVVYKIPCKDCNASYIGETKRSFKVRTNEHKRAVKNQDVDDNEIAGIVGKMIMT